MESEGRKRKKAQRVGKQKWNCSACGSWNTGKRCGNKNCETRSKP